jgi:hypothetical protein
MKDWIIRYKITCFRGALLAAEKQIQVNLDGLLILGVMPSPVKMNLVRCISITDNKVKVALASAALTEER